MKCVLSAAHHVSVIDDLLPVDVFDQLHSFVGQAEYRSVHQGSWKRPWRLSDGNPLVGGVAYSAPREGENTRAYPAGTVLDRFIEAVERATAGAPDAIGTRGSGWADFSVSPWLYPVGAGLSLHADSDAYAGAYTYFLHRAWNLHWGGLLIVLDRDTEPRGDAERAQPTWLADDAENARVWSPGYGLCIPPKPNRLVLIGSAAQHMVTKVDAAAGQHVRMSLAGFFRRSLQPTAVNDRK